MEKEELRDPRQRRMSGPSVRRRPVNRGDSRPQTPPSVRRLLRSVLEPEATAILTSLALEPATSSELADRLGLPAELVRRCLRKLSDRGQVRVGTQVRRRGRLENLYLADPGATVLDPSALAGQSPHLVASGHLALLRTMFREAAAAGGSGIFDRHVDSTLTRFLVPVDEPDLARAVQIHRRLLEEIVEEAREARGRIDRDGGALIASSVQIICFEHPVERWSRPSDPATVRRRPGAGRLERVFEQSADPLRKGVLDLLTVLAATAGTLADLLNTPVDRVRYELDRLLDEGMVDVVGTKPNRGAGERVFIADIRGNTLSTAEVEALGTRASARWDSRVIRSIFAAAPAAIGARGEGSGLYMGRLVSPIDARCFGKIATLAESALAELSDLRDKSLGARAEGVFPDHVVLSGLLAFERM